MYIYVYKYTHTKVEKSKQRREDTITHNKYENYCR